MARKKRRSRRRRGFALSGTPKAASKTNPYLVTFKDGALMLVTAIAAAGAGAVIGKHSLIAGIPVTFLGVHNQNRYIIAAGLGLTLSNGFQNKANLSGTTDGMGALDFKQVAQEAKERVSTFFKNFSQKLYLPQSGDTGQQSEEQVTYFVNPYSTKELDMTAIDRVQEQIAQMNHEDGTTETPVSGLNEIEREY